MLYELVSVRHSNWRVTVYICHGAYMRKTICVVACCGKARLTCIYVEVDHEVGYDTEEDRLDQVVGDLNQELGQSKGVGGVVASCPFPAQNKTLQT